MPVLVLLILTRDVGLALAIWNRIGSSQLSASLVVLPDSDHIASGATQLLGNLVTRSRPASFAQEAALDSAAAAADSVPFASSPDVREECLPRLRISHLNIAGERDRKVSGEPLLADGKWAVTQSMAFGNH
ncbi:hypothetical protein B0T26DRAFT_681201 [Lasiosphaeria miniovina]|uniref:Uncharacterized protein n=1 Tax=Lasiosphaeria miniovina TaxID=1954250 RepID=A0AA39ZTY7_9PEZI|nr:uncharacterized protein B0T26DRAFT_681201 [Lasiosphaeria miniovina]KAK0703542.1 hypothetical protein B0T26DRAFT_681201 [Lasiosphaeria miniovina]